jgi:membrane-bound ClpP family serine protease
MISWISRMVDISSEYLAHRKGLLLLVGLLLIIINLILQFVLPPGWLIESNLFLHLGLVVAILGMLLARIL